MGEIDICRISRGLENALVDVEMIHTVMMDQDLDKLSVGISSVIGKRKEQQDTVRADDDYALMENGKFIAVLCDGMGGLSGGKQASSLCASILFDTFHARESVDDVREFYKHAIAEADRQVNALRNPDGTVMRSGTTLASVVIQDDKLHWASVGDSRIYLIRNNMISCITHDHNYLMQLKEQVNKGEITQEEAETHPKKEALVSYIGMGGVKYTDMNRGPVPLQNHDYIVLCSDGLYKTVAEQDIKDIVLGIEEAKDIAVGLTDYAMAAQKRTQDNTSVIVIHYNE